MDKGDKEVQKIQKKEKQAEVCPISRCFLIFMVTANRS